MLKLAAMNYPTPTLRPLPIYQFATEQSRQRLVAAVIAFSMGIPCLVRPQEQHVLDRFTRGHLTIDEVVYCLEATAKSGTSLTSQ